MVSQFLLFLVYWRGTRNFKFLKYQMHWSDLYSFLYGHIWHSDVKELCVAYFLPSERKPASGQISIHTIYILPAAFSVILQVQKNRLEWTSQPRLLTLWYGSCMGECDVQTIDDVSRMVFKSIWKLGPSPSNSTKRSPDVFRRTIWLQRLHPRLMWKQRNPAHWLIDDWDQESCLV